MTEDVVIAYINASKTGTLSTPDNIVQLKTLARPTSDHRRDSTQKTAVDSSAQESAAARRQKNPQRLYRKAHPDPTHPTSGCLWNGPSVRRVGLINDYCTGNIQPALSSTWAGIRFTTIIMSQFFSRTGVLGHGGRRNR